MDTVTGFDFSFLFQETRVKLRDGDFLGEDGLAVCGQCGLPREGFVQLPSGDQVIKPTPCRCEAEQERERQLKRLRMEAIDLLHNMWSDGLHDQSLLSGAFERDDGHDPATREVCLRYVKGWDQMLTDGTGILFSGSVGTGKSFFASAIANELIQRGVKVCCTSFSRVLNTLGEMKTRQATLDRLQKYDFLLLDDYGTERDTAYAQEIVFDVVDARSRSGKPLVITTNLSVAELQNPSSLAYRRINDRLLEMLPIRVTLQGESRRRAAATDKQKRAREALNGGY